jgi:hypothetical protein
MEVAVLCVTAAEFSVKLGTRIGGAGDEADNLETR